MTDFSKEKSNTDNEWLKRSENNEMTDKLEEKEIKQDMQHSLIYGETPYYDKE